MRHIAATCDTSLQHAANLAHRLKADRARLVDLTPLDRRAGFEARELQRHSGTVALCRVQHDTLYALHCTALHCAQGMRNAEQRRCGLFTAALLRRPLRAALRPHGAAQRPYAAECRSDYR
jgi:hypothetical protein